MGHPALKRHLPHNTEALSLNHVAVVNFYSEFYSTIVPVIDATWHLRLPLETSTMRVIMWKFLMRRMRAVRSQPGDW